jgi:hypothetical protein
VTSPTFFQENLDTIQRLCDSANNIYEQMVRDCLWKNTIKTRPSSTSHVLTVSTIVCFNCGEQHHLNDCPKPKDKQQIESNKSKFRAASSRGPQNSKSNPTALDKKSTSTRRKPFFKW